MKKLVIFFAVFFGLVLYSTVIVQAQGWWSPSGPHIFNNNPGYVGIGDANPVTLLDVKKYMGEPTIRVGNLGAGGGATFQMTDLLSGADWKFKATTTGDFKIRDQASLLDAFYIEQGSALDAIHIKAGGNVGLGFASPVERLDVNGAIRIGNTSSSNPGTIKWDGNDFQGFHPIWGWIIFGSNWIKQANPAPGFGNPQLHPRTPPGSITTGFPPWPNNLAWIHAVDVAAPGLFPHQLACESVIPPFNASMIFQISAAPMQPIANFSQGIFFGDMTYKICSGPVLTPTFQSDLTTMLRTFPNGIVDLPNQSRARAFLVDPNGQNQMIPPNIWTPVNFTLDVPQPQGYDQQNEFVVALAANQPTPPENAFFVALQEGYYQVNARIEFQPEFSQQGGPVQVTPMSYITIAIYTGPGPGATAPYAQGDINQIGMPAGPLFFNNGINVSDVVRLMPGQIISIWVYQTALTPMDLMQGPDKVYVSIHKVS